MFFRSEWFHIEWPFKCVHWCDRPLQGQTSPRWCSCIWWPSRTPRHCRGTLYWSTCLWDVPVSRNTAGRVGKGGGGLPFLLYIQTSQLESLVMCFLLTTSITWALHCESSCMPCRAKSNSFLYSVSVFWASWRPDPVTTYISTQTNVT